MALLSLARHSGRSPNALPDASPNRQFATVALMLAMLASAFLLARPADARGTPDGFADLAERLLPAVVSIQTTQIISQGDSQQFNLPPNMEPFRDFFERFGRRSPEGQQRRGSALGSGFIIDASGTIVTNNHVIEQADEIMVVMDDGTEYKAELIGRDPQIDLAVLKVDAGKSLPFVPFGNSDISRIGDWVVAIGNPMGLGGTVTAGIISARGRDIRSGPYDDFIQTDAPINRGNSGGPLFNMNGEVIGINTAIYSPTGGSIGIGFSIPANQAQRVIEQLKEYGTTRRGWLGVSVQEVTDEIAREMGLDESYGALISQAFPDSPAKAAGILSGDIIIRFDGARVPNSRMLPRMVANTAVGKEVPVVVMRGGREVELTIILGEREKFDLASLDRNSVTPPSRAQNQAIESLGMRLGELTAENRNRFGLEESEEGVVILDVVDSGSAAQKGLRPGNVIVEVNQRPVSSIREVANNVQTALDEGRETVLLRVKMASGYRFVVIQPER